MEIKVLFDSQAIDRKYKTGWGLSFLVDDQIIFDTGENGEWLIENMINLNVDINRIKAVAISHDHWDHTGGLWELLRKKQDLTIYCCQDFSRDFKQKVKMLKGNLIEVDRPTKIAKDIFISAQIPGEYAGRFISEQALVIKSNKGISVLTGCTHPGIIKILQKVRKIFPRDKFYLVAGGFHLIDKPTEICKYIVEQLKELKVKIVGPTHCTGDEARAIFKKEYKENLIELRVGKVVNI